MKNGNKLDDSWINPFVKQFNNMGFSVSSVLNSTGFILYLWHFCILMRALIFLQRESPDDTSQSNKMDMSGGEWKNLKDLRTFSFWLSEHIWSLYTPVCSRKGKICYHFIIWWSNLWDLHRSWEWGGRAADGRGIPLLVYGPSSLLL